MMLESRCPRTKSFPIFLLATLCTVSNIHHADGASVRLKANLSPETSVIKDNLTLTCVGDGTNGANSSTVFLDVRRKGWMYLGSLLCQPIVGTITQTFDSRVTARGRMGNTTENHCVLTLTLHAPRVEDAGTYECRKSFKDKTKKIHEEVATTDVALEAPDTKTTVEYLFNKVPSLEKTVSLQQELIKDQQQTIKSQKESVVRLEKKIDSMSHTVQQLDYNVKLSDYFIKRLEIEYQMLNLTYPVLQTTIDERAKESCAFSMAYNKNDKIIKYSYLRFSQNLTDTCHGYDPGTGLFTAPSKGLYVFHLVVTMEGANDYLEATLKHNGQRSLAKLLAWDSDSGDQSSVTAVVHLGKGGKIGAFVDMCDCDPNHLSDGIYSVFSGYRLK